MTSNVIDLRNAAYDKAAFDLDAFESIAILSSDNNTDVLRIASVESEMRELSDDAALRLLDTLTHAASRDFVQRLYSELSA